MDNITEFIMEKALIIVPVLWIIGTFLKRTPSIKDWYIVWVLAILGVVFTVWMLGFSPDSVLQGFLVAGAAVLTHQLLKQSTERS
jgi:NhaP-type Na+/H+ or K+/H+ antiporter